MWTELKNCLAAEEDRIFLWLPVFLGTGIGLYFLLPIEPPLWIIAGIGGILVLVGWLFRRRSIILRLLVPFFLIVFGFANIQLRAFYLSHRSEPITEGKLYLSGRIDKIDANFRGRQRIILSEMRDFDDNKVSGRYRLTMLRRNPLLKNGDCVELIAAVSPLFHSSLPGGYQFDRKLFFERINGAGYIPSEVLPVECPDKRLRPADWAAALRRSVAQKIENVLPADQAAVAVTIVAGDRSKISRRLTDAYRDSGLAHFLSISGLHMSMIAGLMFFLVRLVMSMFPAFALRFNSKKAAAVLAIFVSAVYLVISGAAIPAERAFIMMFVVLFAVLLDRQAVSMRTLSLAAAVILSVSPEALISAGFQMSFAAVTALIAFYEKFAGRINHFLNAERVSQFYRGVRIIFAYFFGLVTADLVASLATLPFAVYHFNRVALYTSLTNAVAGPLIGFLIMPFVLISLLLMPLGLEWLPLKVVGFGLAEVNGLTTWVAGLPGAAAGIVSVPLWGLLLIVLGGLWLCLWNCRWRIWGTVAVFIGILSIFTTEIPDLIVDREMRTVAIRTNDGFYFLPGADRWNKRNWLGKYALKEAKDIDNVKNVLYPDKVSITDDRVLMVNGRPFDMETSGGAVFYADDDGVRIKTVRDDIGSRPWNSNQADNAAGL